MFNVNTTGDIGFVSAGVVIKRMLKNGNHELIAGKFGQPFRITKNSSLTCKWTRLNPFPRAIAPLAEGVTPAGQPITKDTVTVTMQQYGDWALISDLVFDAFEGDIPKETVDACGTQLGETTELVTIAGLKAGSTVFYANNAGSRGALDSPPLRSDFRRMFRFLQTNKAKMIKKMIGPSEKVSTEPVPDSYIVFGSTDLKADLEDMENYIPWQNYGDPTKRITGAEYGSCDEFRFLLSPLFEPWLAAGASGMDFLSSGDIPSAAAAADVYPLIVVAADAYGVVRLQGSHAVQPAVVYPKAQIADPIAQRGFVSWKILFASLILNPVWCLRYESCASATPGSS